MGELGGKSDPGPPRVTLEREPLDGAPGGWRVTVTYADGSPFAYSWASNLEAAWTAAGSYVLAIVQPDPLAALMGIV